MSAPVDVLAVMNRANVQLNLGHFGAMNLAIEVAEARAAVADAFAALSATEELLAFHEGSAKPEFEGAHPTVRVNGEDWAELTAKVRAALARVLP